MKRKRDTTIPSTSLSRCAQWKPYPPPCAFSAQVSRTPDTLVEHHEVPLTIGLTTYTGTITTDLSDETNVSPYDRFSRQPPVRLHHCPTTQAQVTTRGPGWYQLTKGKLLMFSYPKPLALRAAHNDRTGSVYVRRILARLQNIGTFTKSGLAWQ